MKQSRVLASTVASVVAMCQNGPMADKKSIVVLVEDDSVLADMYIKKFQMEGFTIEHALDGEEGLALVKKLKPDIVLLDIMMPKKNGLDTLKDIRADAELKNTFVVLLTNVGEQSYVDEGTRLGANQYLMKSNFTPREIVDKVREWLGQKV